MFVSRHQNVGQNHSFMTANESFEMRQFQVFENNSNESKFYS